MKFIKAQNLFGNGMHQKMIWILKFEHFIVAHYNLEKQLQFKLSKKKLRKYRNFN